MKFTSLNINNLLIVIFRNSGSSTKARNKNSSSEGSFQSLVAGIPTGLLPAIRLARRSNEGGPVQTVESVRGLTGRLPVLPRQRRRREHDRDAVLGYALGLYRALPEDPAQRAHVPQCRAVGTFRSANGSERSRVDNFELRSSSVILCKDNYICSDICKIIHFRIRFVG